MTATFLAMNINKSIAAAYLRCDWHTIMRCISRVRNVLEPDIKKRYDGLVNIGTDETSYRKGHNYVTTVVNHDTNTIVWCAPGHSTEVLSKFFEELTEEQRQSIKTVSGEEQDGLMPVLKSTFPMQSVVLMLFMWLPGLQLFWMSWRDAYRDVKEQTKELNRKRGKPKDSDVGSKKLNEAKKKASDIKTSTYTLGKAPENLTANQAAKLEMIANTNPSSSAVISLKNN